MSTARKDDALVPIPGSQGGGLTHEEFMAVNGMAPMPENAEPSAQPVLVYEQAVRAVQACRSIDEAKYWNSKAEALAAWAKVYTDDRILREARALKLHAYRRLGEIASQIQPSGGTSGKKGEIHLLRGHGFRHSQAREMVRISRMPLADFTVATEAKRPPSPSYLERHVMRPNPEWAEVSQRMNVFLHAVRNYDAEHVAANLDAKQSEKAEKIVNEMIEWLDCFTEKLRE